jgi:uncharacterized protein (TIGR00251 family)
VDESLALRLRVQPGAGRDAVLGRYGEKVKISIAAPAVDGQANTALIRFLAKEFGVKQSQVRIAGGAGSRNKRVLIDDPARLPSWWPPSP